MDLSATGSADLAQAQRIATAAAKDPAARLRAAASETEIEDAATEFEAIFLAQMMQPMFEGIKTDGPFGGGHSETIYRSMLIDQFAKDIAAGGGIGVAAQIKAELLKAQEAAQSVPPAAAPISEE